MRRWLPGVLAVATSLVIVGWGAAPADAVQAAPLPSAGPVVLIGVPDLQWGDVSRTATPALWRLAAQSSIGTMTDQSGEGDAHRATGWMTLNTGSRAVAYTDPPRAVPDPADPVQLARLEKLNAGSRFHSRVGALGDALHRAGKKVAAVYGAGAVVGGMDGSGAVDIRASSVADALAQQADVVMAELPQLYDVDRADQAAVRGALAAIDTQVAAIEAQVPADATLLVAGVSDAANTQAHLHVAMAQGPWFGPGRLTSPSTGRAGVVQLIDVAPTVLWLSGAPVPVSVIGEHWQSLAEARTATATEIAQLVDLDRRSVAQVRIQPPYFRWIALAAVLYVAVVIGCWGRRRAGPPLFLTGLVAALPVASWLLQLVPWWRISTWWIGPITAGFALLIAALAGLSRWPADPRWRPAAVVGGVSAAVIVVDVATGSNLSLDAPFGDNPIVAGRFTGTGNDAFAILGTGALLLATAIASRTTGRRAAAAVLSVGAVAVVVIGYPGLGDKFGGVLALVPTVALLAVWVSGARVTGRYLRVIAGAVLAAVAGVVTFALIDYARPASRQTHLGRFVGQVIHGQAWPIVMRKAQSSLATFTTGWSRWVVLVWLLLAVVFLIARRRGWVGTAPDVPPRVAGGLAVAVLVLGVLGPALNDSGLSITAFVFFLGAPLLVPFVEPRPSLGGWPARPARDLCSPAAAGTRASGGG